jgi:YD repeat-containing protein
MKRILVAFVLLAPAMATALVDMRNANYSDTWVDIEVPGGGFELKVERTYNSRSLFNGMFGFGWCSEFETSLEVEADSSLKLTECGAGFEVVYTADGFTPKNVDAAVKNIVTKYKEKNPATSGRFLSDLENQLRGDRRLRDKYASELGIQGSLTKNETFFANGKGPEVIERKDGEFLRKLPGGSTQKFNSNGQLIQVEDKNGNYVKFTYSGDTIRDAVDNNGRKLTFTYFPNKKVKSIVGPNDLKAEYKFEKLNELAWVKNGWKNDYSYDYDDLKNLTKISYPDKTTKVLTYEKSKDWVTSFKERDGCKEDYKYELSKDDPKNHYWSTVIKKCENKVVNNSRYEFWYKLNRAKTDKFLSRVLTKVNNDTTDVYYHETFGRPTSIVRNGIKMEYTYDTNTGLLRTRKEPTRSVDFEYDTGCKKVSKVTEGKNKTDFKYDKRCNLVLAKNTKGQLVNLTYDHQGRIATLLDQAKREVKIKYETRFGKPETVERPGVGTIKVTYKPNGDINKVDSPAGPTVAVQVASTFNNLLDIVEPAGVELGF